MAIIGESDGPTAILLTSDFQNKIIGGIFLLAAVGAVILACWLYRRYTRR